MGTLHEFRCPACAYEAHVSGGLAGGMRVLTQTIHCKDCRVIDDVVVARSSGGRGPRRTSAEESRVPPCPKDASHDVSLWRAGGPCPRCGATMERGEHFIQWD